MWEWSNFCENAHSFLRAQNCHNTYCGSHAPIDKVPVQCPILLKVDSRLGSMTFILSNQRRTAGRSRVVHRRHARSRPTYSQSATRPAATARAESTVVLRHPP